MSFSTEIAAKEYLQSLRHPAKANDRVYLFVAVGVSGRKWMTFAANPVEAAKKFDAMGGPRGSKPRRAKGSGIDEADGTTRRKAYAIVW